MLGIVRFYVAGPGKPCSVIILIIVSLDGDSYLTGADQVTRVDAAHADIQAINAVVTSQVSSVHIVAEHLHDVPLVRSEFTIVANALISGERGRVGIVEFHRDAVSSSAARSGRD